jgi:hypothetical protein
MMYASQISQETTAPPQTGPRRARALPALARTPVLSISSAEAAAAVPARCDHTAPSPLTCPLLQLPCAPRQGNWLNRTPPPFRVPGGPPPRVRRRRPLRRRAVRATRSPAPPPSHGARAPAAAHPLPAPSAPSLSPPRPHRHRDAGTRPAARRGRGPGPPPRGPPTPRVARSASHAEGRRG